MRHPIVFGSLWGLLAAACIAVPRAISTNAVMALRSELVAGHERVESMLDECLNRPAVMQQTNTVTVPTPSSPAELEDKRVRDILAKWEQSDGLPSVARAASTKDRAVP